MLKDAYIRYANFFRYVSLRKGKGTNPLPLAYWEDLRKSLLKKITKEDVLLPAQRMLKSNGSVVNIGSLKPLIRDKEIGTWTLDRYTIEYLWQRLSELRPAVLAECGCGISSLLIATYLAEKQPQGFCISFEQDIREKERMDKELKQAGLERYVEIIHTPLDRRGYYMFDEKKIAGTLRTRKLDCILVDGPGGPAQCRESTLPALKSFASTVCHWFLDDALRDGEMQILRNWEQVPGMTVSGIIPVGKGLGAGTIAGNSN